MTSSPSSLIRTSEEQNDVVGLLEEMLAENFKKRPNPKSANTSSFLSNFYSYLLDRIKMSGGGRESNENLLKDISSEVKNLKKIKITLAAYPNETTLDILEKWLNRSGFENYIFDILVDKKILGGAIIVGEKGDYKDFSLGRSVDSYLSKEYLA